MTVSRSYKKHPYVKYNKHIRRGKKRLHKKIRRTEDIPNGNVYRKYFERWYNIYDGKDIERYQEILLGWNNQEEWTQFYKSFQEVYKEWITTWKGK
jgi:hypothetical protein